MGLLRHVTEVEVVVVKVEVVVVKDDADLARMSILKIKFAIIFREINRSRKEL